MVWNALAMQYRLGFQASSDHISTHISYAIALAEDTTAAGDPRRLPPPPLLRRDRQHLLDVRSGEHLMGDEFDADGPVKLKVFVHGTGRSRGSISSRISGYVYSTEPKNEQVEFEWTDDEQGRPAGLSWYYVRAIQDDGELAWASPIWVHTR